MEPGEDDLVVMPLYTVTMVYGLTREGEGMTSTTWENHRYPEDDVDHMAKAGMVGMLQSEVFAEGLGLVEDDDED